MSDIIKSLPTKLESIKTAPDCSFVHNEKRVLICVCTHQWIEFFAYIACVLLHRGCRVDFVWSTYYETDNVNQVRHVDLMLNVFEPILNSLEHDKLRVMQLKDIPMANLNGDILQELDILSREDTIRIAYEVRADHEGKHRRLYNRQLHCNYEVMASLLYLHKQNNYETVLTFSGKSCEMGATYRLMQQLGVPICTIEDLPFGKEAAVRKSWKYPAVVLSKETVEDDWNKRKTYQVTEKTLACNNMFKQRLNTLDNPYSSMQFAKSGRVEELVHQFKINKKTPTILILPSFTFELHCWVEHHAFIDSVEWFRETLHFLANRDNCQVIVRAHPYPGYTKKQKDPLGLSASSETPEAMIQGLFDHWPDNICFVEATDEVNTYDLMEIADMAICYTSTSGLEMAVRGKASIVPTSAHYTEKGFTFSPKGKEAYYELINDLIKNPKKMRLTQEQIALAQCYIETIYFDSVTSLPWTITAAHLHEQWPLERLVSLEGILSVYTDNIDSIIQDDYKPFPEKKLMEFNNALNTIGNYKNQKKWDKAKFALGDFSKIDMNYVSQQYPVVYEKMCGQLKDIVEVAVFNATENEVDALQIQVLKIIKDIGEDANSILDMIQKIKIKKRVVKIKKAEGKINLKNIVKRVLLKLRRLTNIRNKKVTARVDSAQQPILLMSIDTYNIVTYKGKVYGFPQALGPVDLENDNLDNLSGFICKTSLGAVKAEIRNIQKNGVAENV